MIHTRSSCPHLEQEKQGEAQEMLYMLMADAYRLAGIQCLPQRDKLALDNSSPYHWWKGHEIFPSATKIWPGSGQKRKQGGINVQGFNTIKPLASWSVHDCVKVLQGKKKLQCVVRAEEEGPRFVDSIEEEEINAILSS